MKKQKYTHLAYEERFTIEKLFNANVAIRSIAEFLGRSPNTISREIKKNSVKGIYTAEKAHKKTYFKRWRSKRQCMKVSLDRFLIRFVEKKLQEKWSPKQISGYLRREYEIECSSKAIYKWTRRRGLDYLLFWGWNKRRSGKKRYQYNNPKDGRKWIDERPLTNNESGHFEMDFIVSRQSTWVFLVVTDRVAKMSFVEKLPNRKHTTVCGALSAMFSGVDVKSITTDNDIAFACWEKLEKLLNTQIYFTHPYHSWEKGLVENTNRWIRCFVPKKRDIATVTDEEMKQIHSFINNRPRESIGFRIPSEYYYKTIVLLRG
jgi:transposase, IS30 family